MNQEGLRSQQGVSPQSTGLEVGDGTTVEHHHHHHHRSHHHNRSPQSDDTIPHKILKAKAIMAADKTLIDGVASKGKLIQPPSDTVKQPVFGLINFEQTPQGVHITGHVEGLGQGTSHGFHIHEFGDLSSGCTTAGAHFNPFNRAHGGPNDPERHLGDLGNVTADVTGVAHIDILDPVISLQGEHSIVGRAIVVHAMPDDLGRGGNEESTKTGNAGGRLACGIIGLTKPQEA